MRKTNTRSLSVGEVEKLVENNPPLRNVGRPKPTVVLVEGRPCVRLPLTKGKFAMVDPEDFASIANWNWHTIAGGSNGRNFYAARRSKNPRAVTLMHRAILNHDMPETDHRNGDGLDNRRSNIRPATHSQNMSNRACWRTSSYKGVEKIGLRFKACITTNGKRRYLGSFNNPVSASKAYQMEAVKQWGEFANAKVKKTN